jgi:hypothetical protein
MYAVPATRNKEETNMAKQSQKEFLQEHFRKHDSITLYKAGRHSRHLQQAAQSVFTADISRVTFKDLR